MIKNVRNADNEELQPWGGGGMVFGSVDEVNGAGAEEIPFVATRHELLQLAKFWAKEAMEIEWGTFVKWWAVTLSESSASPGAG